MQEAPSFPALLLSELTHVKRMLWTKYSCFSDLRFFCFVSLWVEGGKRMDCLPHQVVRKPLKEDGTPLAPLSLLCLAAEWDWPHGPGLFLSWTLSLPAAPAYVSLQCCCYMTLHLQLERTCWSIHLSTRLPFLPCEQSFNSLFPSWRGSNTLTEILLSVPFF